MKEFGFAMAPGNEIFVEVDPRMLTAEPGISKVPHEKRACYLQHEKSLAYFQHYSYMNCFRECLANHTQKREILLWPKKCFRLPEDLKNTKK